MSLENSITELNVSVQALIALMNAQSAPVSKPKAVKAAKPAPVKKAKTTTSFEFVGLNEECAVATDSTCAGTTSGSFVGTDAAAAAASAAGNFPSLEEVIDEMRNIKDRTVLSELMQGFGSTRASDIPEEKRSAFIEALQMELQKGAA
jgi:hypothetical protein